MHIIAYKQELVKKLYSQGILCTLAFEKRGLNGWNKIEDKEKYLQKTLKLIEKYPECNLAINLEPSNLICLDIDDPEKFQRIYKENFDDTLSCKTPRGYHFYFANDINLTQNISLPKFGFEIHCKHLSNFFGKNYKLNLKEIKKASDYKPFFSFLFDLLSQSQTKLTQNKDISLLESNWHTDIYNKKSINIQTSIRGKKGDIIDVCMPYTPAEIFKKFEELEGERSFIEFVFRFVFSVEAKKNMLCVLHEERNPSASVFKSNITGKWLYKDFHTFKTYSILDLLLEYFNTHKHLQKVYRKALAIYLIRVFEQENKELKIANLLRDRGEILCKCYLIVKSLDTLQGEIFLGVRDLAKMLGLRDITKANRLLNFLCLIELFEKYERGYGRAYGYRVRDINIENLERELARTRHIDIYRLSKEEAMKYFDNEKVEEIYKRAGKERAGKEKIEEKEFGFNPL